MTFCLDTDIIIEFFRGNNKVIERINKHNDKLFVTPITLCELFKGASLSSHPERESVRVKSFVKDCNIIDFSLDSCISFGEIFANLTKEGKIINEADLLIASMVLTNELTIVTNNTKHFSRIKGLKIENWLK